MNSSPYSSVTVGASNRFHRLIRHVPTTTPSRHGLLGLPAKSGGAFGRRTVAPKQISSASTVKGDPDLDGSASVRGSKTRSKQEKKRTDHNEAAGKPQAKHKAHGLEPPKTASQNNIEKAWSTAEAVICWPGTPPQTPAPSCTDKNSVMFDLPSFPKTDQSPEEDPLQSRTHDTRSFQTRKTRLPRNTTWDSPSHLASKG